MSPSELIKTKYKKSIPSFSKEKSEKRAQERNLEYTPSFDASKSFSSLHENAHREVAELDRELDKARLQLEELQKNLNDSKERERRELLERQEVNSFYKSFDKNNR